MGLIGAGKSRRARTPLASEGAHRQEIGKPLLTHLTSLVAPLPEAIPRFVKCALRTGQWAVDSGHWAYIGKVSSGARGRRVGKWLTRTARAQPGPIRLKQKDDPGKLQGRTLTEVTVLLYSVLPRRSGMRDCIRCSRNIRPSRK